jgi:2-dehydro-3-deoxyphosphogluconate aldolase/(4S)-4-hydroxy-2-oxoglutarate aldolase
MMKEVFKLSKAVYEEILDNKIVAIVRGVKPGQMLRTVEALYQGGIKLLEVTFDQTSPETLAETKASLELIAKSSSQEILMGAGTVVTVDQVDTAIKCGAEYIISPNTDVNVIQRTKELGKISIPGAFTPSEAIIAYQAGADLVKLFPAGLLGAGYVKALRGPLGYIPFVAVGGIDVNNVQDFLKAGVKGVGIGGNLVDVKAINKGEYHKLTEVARKYMEKIAS